MRRHQKDGCIFTGRVSCAPTNSAHFPIKNEVSFTTAENLTGVGIVPELVTFIFIAKPAIFSFDHPDFCDNISAKTAFGSLRKASREEPTQEAHG
jgi:hypothetical protein